MTPIDNFTLHLLEEMKQCGIYKITNKVTNKIYIGSVCTSSTSKKKNNFRRRWQFHINSLRRNKHNNPHLQYSFNKYGEESFVFEIIETIEDKYNVPFILKREQYYLDLYKPYISDIGYNKMKTSMNLKINIKTKESTKQTLSALFKGKKRPDYIFDSLVKPVLQYSLDGEFIEEYRTAKEAFNITGIQRQDIGKCCLGKIKSAGNYQWKYKNSNKVIKPYCLKYFKKNFIKS